MQINGLIIHDSACSSINGKGYDYRIMPDGMIVPSSEKCDPNWIHLCVEGNFSSPLSASKAHHEQFFVMQKLLLRLLRMHRLSPDLIVRHSSTCPGEYFPWPELVISPADGYH